MSHRQQPDHQQYANAYLQHQAFVDPSMQEVNRHPNVLQASYGQQQQFRFQHGFGPQNPTPVAAQWSNLPSQYAPASIQAQYQAYPQQPAMMHMQPGQAYPQFQVFRVAAPMIAKPAGWPSYPNYPSGPHLAQQQGAIPVYGAGNQIPLITHQHHQQQQPNPSYPQTFVPPTYAGGTRPASNPGGAHTFTHFQAAAPPFIPQQQPPQQPSYAPQHGVGGIGMEQPQPVVQQPVQVLASGTSTSQPRERTRLTIVNPSTNEEVKLPDNSAAGRGSTTTAAPTPTVAGHQASPAPPVASVGGRTSQALPIEKPSQTGGQTVQKEMLKMRATASAKPAPPPAAAPAPASAAAPPAAAAAPTQPQQPPTEAATLPTSTPATLHAPVKPSTPLPSPELSEAPPAPPALAAASSAVPKTEAPPPTAAASMAKEERPAAEAPTSQAQLTTSPPAAASPAPVNGVAAVATDGSHQSASPQVESTAATISRKSSTDAGERPPPQPQPPQQRTSSIKYEFKPDPGESDLKIQEKKLKYDREFLLKLQFTNLSSQRPDELPGDIPELLPRADSQQAMKMMAGAGTGPGAGAGAGRSFDFTPSYVQPIYQKDKGKPGQGYGGAHRGGGGGGEGGRGGGGGGVGGGGGRSGMSGGGGGSQRYEKAVVKPMVIEVRKEKVDLHKTEQAYVPGFLQKKTEDHDQVKKEDIERNIRSILNKIAPQNFESCFSQLTTTCDIGSITGLNSIVDIIFDKATREKSYSSVFAEICKRLAFLKVNIHEQPLDSNKQFVGFRSLLLKKCQEMFETPLKDQMEQKGAQWDERITSEEKEDKKKTLEEERDEQVKKVKDQYYGNIRFIGELFMKDILTANIIHQCIVSQLKSDHGSRSMFTESLECLCELLKTVGKKLESENNAKGRIDQYFERIKKLINSKEIESKVRFRLQDIVDMRQRSWERREMEIRLHEKPMTKEELDLKSKQEEESKMRQMAGMQQGRSGRPGPGYNRPPAGPAAPPVPPGGEWTAVTAPRKAQKMDVRKMVIGISEPNPSTQTRLGPQRPLFGKQARPGKDEGGRATPSSSSRLGSQKNSRESSASRGTSRESSPHIEPQAVKIPRSMSTQELPARAVESTPLSRDVLERKSKNIMMEWLGSLCSLEDTKSNFMEIAHHPDIRLFVEVNADHLLNENSKELRERGGQLLFELLHGGLLSSKDLIEGFSNIMEMAEDFLSDFPHLGSYLGEIFSSFVQKAASYLHCVQQLLLRIPAELRDSSRRPLRGEILSRALHLASGRLGHERVGAAFREANIEWPDLLQLPQPDAASFVAVTQLEFTLHQMPVSPAPSVTLDKVGDQIEQQILSAAESSNASDQLSEKLIALIEKEVATEQLEKQEFYRVLARSVCRGCTCNKKLDKTLYRAVKPVLLRYVDNQEQRRWLLSATCDTVKSAGLPLELLNDIFFAFLDNSIVCEDSFKQWHDEEASQDMRDAIQTVINTLESTHSQTDSS